MQRSHQASSSRANVYLSVADPLKTPRVRGIREGNDDDELRRMTPAERLGMMWQLTLDAWAFRRGFDAESRLSRHTLSVKHRTR
jgi:hypothetical protein